MRIATRGSALALRQAELVADLLVARAVAVEIVPVTTAGDRDKSTPLTVLGQGVFVKGVEEMLSSGLADVAVHSLKDVPPALTPGLELVAFPLRADPRDGLVAAHRHAAEVRGGGVRALPRQARVGTGSPRRAAQLHAVRDDLRILPIRGNLDTRIRKLRAGEYDAIVVALAGLERLGRADEADWTFGADECTPAAGQGTLVIQCRSGDRTVAAIVAAVDDPQVRTESLAERAFLAALGGGCQLPAGALARQVGRRLAMVGVVASEDGRRLLRERVEGNRTEPEALGQALAERMLPVAERLLVGARG